MNFDSEKSEILLSLIKSELYLFKISTLLQWFFHSFQGLVPLVTLVRVISFMFIEI